MGRPHSSDHLAHALARGAPSEVARRTWGRFSRAHRGEHLVAGASTAATLGEAGPGPLWRPPAGKSVLMMIERAPEEDGSRFVRAPPPSRADFMNAHGERCPPAHGALGPSRAPPISGPRATSGAF